MSQLRYTCTVDDKQIHGATDSSARPDAAVDAADVHAVYDAARDQLRVGRGAPVTCSRIDRAAPRQAADLEWINRRMTPSCKNVGWDPSQVISFDRWQCRYVGKGTTTDEHGNRVEMYNPFKTWSGTIASCAALDEQHADLRIPDSTMDAVRRWAYHQADGDAHNLDVNAFVCSVDSIPRM